MNNMTSDPLKQTFFEFYLETEAEEPQLNLYRLIEGLNHEETHDLLLSTLNDALTEINKLGKALNEVDILSKENAKLKKRLDRYMEEEEHSHDDQVTLNIRVEKLETGMFGICGRRTWFGKLFFKKSQEKSDEEGI